MILNKYCYLPIEQIWGSFKVPGSLYPEKVEIKIQLCRIYDSYDEVIWKTVSASIHNSTLSFVLANGFEKGLYAILGISIGEHIVYGCFNDNENCETVFAITEKNINSVDLYKRILSARNGFINRAKHRTNEKNASCYDVFIFIKNLDISITAYYDTIQVYPFDYLISTGEINYINKFLQASHLNVTISEKAFEHSTPSAVFLITNIMANNYDDAEQFAIQEAEKLNSIFTVLLHSHGTIFAALVDGKKDRKYRTNILNLRYKGNLLHLAENCFNIQHCFKYLNNNNTYMTVYLKLLRDAQSENDRMMKYYRYWNILEGLAMRNQYSNHPMRDWQGNIVNSKKGVCLIGNEALNNVFELVRNHCSNTPSASFVQGLSNITKPKEFLSVCYQRRNCCAHWGDCNQSSASICDPKKDYMARCKICNVIDDTQPEGFKDAILRKLEDITFSIVWKELKNQTGEYTKNESLINNIL